MRLSSTSIALVSCLCALRAQAASGGQPVTLTQSGFVLGADDAALNAGSVAFEFRVFAGATPTGGEVVEWEASCALPVSAGYYAAVLGVAPCAGSSALETSDVPPGATRWLEVAIGGTTLAPRLAVSASPAAALAADALSLGGVAAAGWVQKAELAAGGTGNVDAARLTSGTLPAARLAGTYGQAVSFTNAANVLAGDGAAITGLDASHLVGTLPSGRLSGTYGDALAFTNAGNAFTGSGAGLTGLSASNLTTGTVPGAQIAGTYGSVISITNAGNTLAGNGAAITGLNASNLATGTIPSARLTGTYSNDLTLTGAVAVPNGLAIPNGTNLPGTAGPVGSVFFRTSDQVLYVSTGSAWAAMTSGGGSGGWPLGSSGNPAASCSAIKAAVPTAATSIYYLTAPGGSFAAWCDMDTDGGGWTLVMAATDAARWRGYNAVWTDSTWDSGVTVTPSVPGKSLAYLQVAGDQVLFKTHAEAAGRWAEFDMPAASTLSGLVGSTTLLSLGAGYQKTLTGRAIGNAAHPCWAGDWRVMYRSYPSGDAGPDSSVFAPAGVIYGRPCGGAASWGTGLGVATDSNTAQGSTFEGYGSEASGNSAVTGGYVAIYVRTKPAGTTPALGSVANPATSCKAIQQAGAAGASGPYYLTGALVGRYQAYCDFGTDIDAAGGWTLVMSTNDGAAWKGFNSVWWDTTVNFPTASGPVSPTTFGKSVAYLQATGTELVFRTHAEAAGRWARYSLPSANTLAGLLGTTNLSSQSAGFRATLTKVAVGANAVACFNQDWRVSWRSYPSNDGALDSSVFAPSLLTSTVRPCGGSNAYATGFGVQTDSSGAYGGSFEGYGSDGAGNQAVSGGYLSLYVR